MPTVEERLTATFGKRLLDRGFTKAGRRKWAQEGPRYLKFVCDIRAFKGANYCLGIGVGIDFVPLWTGPGFRRKRTLSSCEIALFLVPPFPYHAPVSFRHLPGPVGSTLIATTRSSRVSRAL